MLSIKIHQHQNPMGLEIKNLTDLNYFIHANSQLFDYHMEHLKLAKRYSWLLNKKLGDQFDPLKLEYICISHDLLKDRPTHGERLPMEWSGYKIPSDIHAYVRLNLDILEKFGLEDFFIFYVQLHSLAAAIFLYKEMKIQDEEILYPIMFHSCPILSIYLKLNKKIQGMVDLITLADKLSSNYLKINMREKKVHVDLDQVVFGNTGKEFNYTLGLYIARLISQGESKEEQSKQMTEYYRKRLSLSNPFIAKKKYSLGGMKTWPKRNSLVWKMQ
jgi:HD superfamily phosphohydrolase YqeK